ncbi:Ribonuclease BN, tRNA processing enzyme [Actinacidiphila yanglinensis]|uniref:Ribonuclease BN, tRNA processing enzyme n=1 Tax=Actinacidiphila yanglinensis TaxID=310779 RepID=A0A1H6DVV6_9ACTN|nr:Ribonuclease BN, tRNA processing enzyme [Actinacidiphila yanglinensis]
MLGTCGGWPEAGRAGSGFLVEYDGFRLVLDLGYATFPRLLRYCDGEAGRVDAVVVTHAHPDHCADLSALSRARYFAADRLAGGAARGPAQPVPLYCPPEVVERVQAMEPSEDLREVFAVHELPGRYPVGPFLLTGTALPHHVPHSGVRLTAPGLVLAYTGDAGPAPALAELAAGADLLVAGATVLPDGPDPDGGTGGAGTGGDGGDRRYDGPPPQPELLGAADAGRWAARCGARRLLLTHFWPGGDRAAWVARARAGAAESGAADLDVVAAEEDMVIPLPRP